MNRLNRLLLVIRHAYAMWQALNAPKNRSKGSWDHIEPHMLIRLAKGELEELHVALWQFGKGEAGADRVEEEAADLSAYAAMIADMARKKEKAASTAWSHNI